MTRAKATGDRRTIVVIGGVAAGASAAAKARREDERARIIVFERGRHVSFANCGLPYFVGGEIQSRDDLLLQTPESLKRRFDLEVHVEHEVHAIIPAEQLVRVRDLRGGEVFETTYDRLVIATGAAPIVPLMEGVESRNVVLLRTVPEAERLKRLARSGHAGRAVVIGAGFIGLEAVENLRRQGLDVALVERMDQVLPPFDPEMTIPIEDALAAMGVEPVMGLGVKRFIKRRGLAVAAQLDDGSEVPGDVFLLSIGARPDVSLAREAGIALGPSGAIAVDERMETSIPGIFAAGDVAETRHVVSGRPVWIPLAGPASKQGRVAGANAAGRSMTFKGAYGTTIVRVGAAVAAKTGLSERECLAAGFDCRITYNQHADHAAYYPGAQALTIKLISDRRTGRILGAQITGGRGVDKRIDVVATAIRGRMTVEDLEDLDLAYAPPFGAARDPIIMAGMVQADLHRGELVAITPAELAARLSDGRSADRGLQIVDVRNKEEWKQGMIPGAVGLPLPELRERLGELDPGRETIVYCQSGQRSYFATRLLGQRGFSRVSNLTGGFVAWRLHARMTERRAAQRPTKTARAMAEAPR